MLNFVDDNHCVEWLRHKICKKHKTWTVNAPCFLIANLSITVSCAPKSRKRIQETVRVMEYVV